MTIANALKEFFFKLNGVKPGGTNIAEVIRAGASGVQLNNESALATRVTALEADTTKIFLNSSTADSVKRFSISVVDDGTISATEVDANGDPVSEP